jgi:hypothetical protein
LILNNNNISIIIGYLLLLFCPPISLIYGLICLNQNKYNNNQRITLAINIAIAISILAASRQFLYLENDDFQTYFNNYLEIYSGNYSPIYEFGDGYEIGLGVLNLLISIISPKLTVNGLMFTYSLIATLLFIFYIERYKKNKIESEKYAIYIATCFLFFGYYFCTQITRQFFSAIFVLIALESTNKTKTIFYIALGFLFHITAVPLYALIIFYKKYKENGIIILGLIGAGFYILIFIINIISLPEVVSSKMYYHLTNDNQDYIINYGPFRWVFIVAIIGIINYNFSKFNGLVLPNKNTVKIAIYLCILYGLLIPYTLLPIRILAAYNFLYIGVALAIMLNNLSIGFNRILIMLIIIWKSNNYLFEGSIGQWNAYPMSDVLPLYYLKMMID